MSVKVILKREVVNVKICPYCEIENSCEETYCFLCGSRLTLQTDESSKATYNFKDENYNAYEKTENKYGERYSRNWMRVSDSEMFAVFVGVCFILLLVCVLYVLGEM